jgi:hypothetical protein
MAEGDRGLGAWLYRNAYVFALVAVTALVIVSWLKRAPSAQSPAAQERADGGDGG